MRDQGGGKKGSGVRDGGMHLHHPDLRGEAAEEVDDPFSGWIGFLPTQNLEGS